LKTSRAPFLTTATLGVLLLARPLPAAELTCQVTNSKGGGPVIEAALALIPLDRPAPPVTAEGAAEVAQEGQEFFAYVTVVQAGTKVTFPNRDSVQHHVYSLSKAKKFELPLYNPGQAESQVFETSGMVAIGCNIHDWMTAYVFVVPTPWFAKSDTAGSATLTAPAGRYRLEVWHPRLSTPLTQEIVLTDGEPQQRDLSLTLKPDRRIRRGGGGKTGGYR